MNSFRPFLKTVAAAVLLCGAGLASAADTQSLAVSASVSGMCKFVAPSKSMVFSAIDPSGTADATASASVIYKCTKGTLAPTVVTSDASLTRTMTGTGTASGSSLGYTLGLGTTSAGLGFGPSGDLTLAVTGTITAAQYQNVAAGPYSESVTLNITP